MSTGMPRIVAAIGIVLLHAGCAGNEPAKQEQPAKAAQQQPKAPFVPADACALITKEEVQSITGKKVLEPYKETAANLVTCSFGEPGTPQVGGRPLSKVVGISVFTGQEGTYYAGPVAQAKEAFETGRRNAADPQNVPGLGEASYWAATLHTLSAYKAKYEVGITVERAAGLDVARQLMSKALQRLPQ